jgi:tetratricopeptide (TPR) repeat protein
MRSLIGWRRKSLAAFVIAVCFMAGAVARADVIVLKNGRRISAINIQEAEGRVTGETPAGTITLPASLVERIEKDAAGTSRGAELRWAPPATRLTVEPEASASVASGGRLDRDALQRIRREAIGGEAAALARAAAAESAAGEFEFKRGNLEAALDHAERALGYAPGMATLLTNVAYLHLRREDYGTALSYLERARRAAPDSADVAKLSGWAYYGLNRLPQAVEEWKRSQQLVPDADVAKALEKASRDLEAERSFREDGSAHFLVRYDGASKPELARGILYQLEHDMRGLSMALDYTPPEPIAVVLYTNQVFADITRAPAWVGALNDGRIRVPVEGLTSVTPELARVLRHELVHSLITGKTRGRCPVWLHEGVAQWMEGKRVGPAAVELVAKYDRHEDPALGPLEESWMHMTPDAVKMAYAWSLATIEALAANGGQGDIERLLDRIVSEPNAEAAVRSVARTDYTGLNRATADYLRRAARP